MRTNLRDAFSISEFNALLQKEKVQFYHKAVNGLWVMSKLKGVLQTQPNIHILHPAD